MREESTPFRCESGKRCRGYSGQRDKSTISIVNEIQEPVRLSVLCERRILEYFGLVNSTEGSNLERDILFGKAPVKESERKIFDQLVVYRSMTEEGRRAYQQNPFCKKQFLAMSDIYFYFYFFPEH